MIIWRSKQELARTPGSPPRTWCSAARKPRLWGTTLWGEGTIHHLQNEMWMDPIGRHPKTHASTRSSVMGRAAGRGPSCRGALGALVQGAPYDLCTTHCLSGHITFVFGVLGNYIERPLINASHKPDTAFKNATCFYFMIFWSSVTKRLKRVLLNHKHDS